MHVKWLFGISRLLANLGLLLFFCVAAASLSLNQLINPTCKVFFFFYNPSFITAVSVL